VTPTMSELNPNPVSRPDRERFGPILPIFGYGNIDDAHRLRERS
jgi:acyl-CoA reductase-like NAD-dependent aldehyde dehydrogenase